MVKYATSGMTKDILTITVRPPLLRRDNNNNLLVSFECSHARLATWPMPD